MNIQLVQEQLCVYIGHLSQIHQRAGPRVHSPQTSITSSITNKGPTGNRSKEIFTRIDINTTHRVGDRTSDSNPNPDSNPGSSPGSRFWRTLSNFCNIQQFNFIYIETYLNIFLIVLRIIPQKFDINELVLRWVYRTYTFQKFVKMKENESDEEDNVINNDRSGWGHPMKKAYHKKMSRMWDHFLQFSIDKTKVVCSTATNP